MTDTADIGELVRGLEALGDDLKAAGEQGGFVCARKAARALTALEARCAEFEKERDALKRGRDAWATDASELAGELTLRDRIEREPVVTDEGVRRVDIAITRHMNKHGPFATLGLARAALEAALASREAT